eukprot:4657927-Alexandrium_andersonii.AAC.1
MSASLVGSEMCIRDRLLRSPGRCRLDRFGHPPDAEGRGRAGHQHSGPVSYTHLTLPTICSV